MAMWIVEEKLVIIPLLLHRLFSYFFLILWAVVYAKKYPSLNSIETFLDHSIIYHYYRETVQKWRISLYLICMRIVNYYYCCCCLYYSWASTLSFQFFFCYTTTRSSNLCLCIPSPFFRFWLYLSLCCVCLPKKRSKFIRSLYFFIIIIVSDDDNHKKFMIWSKVLFGQIYKFHLIENKFWFIFSTCRILFHLCKHRFFLAASNIFSFNCCFCFSIITVSSFIIHSKLIHLDYHYFFYQQFTSTIKFENRIIFVIVFVKLQSSDNDFVTQFKW